MFNQSDDMQDDDPFADLVPASQADDNAFGDLVPEGANDDDPFADLTPVTEQPDVGSDMGLKVRPDGIKVGGMRAAEQSVLDERVISPLRRGYYRGKQGVSLMLDELGVTSGDQAGLAVRLSENQRLSERYGASLEDEDAMRRVSEADSIGDVFSELIDNPQVISNITLESMGLMAPGLAATAGASVVGGPLATALAAGVGSGSTEYAQTISSVLQENGVDPSRPQDWAKALANPELMSRARESGVKRGVSVAAFDALTAGLAGKIIGGAKGGIISPVARASGELGLQAAGGMAGETTAQLADKGQIESVGEIALEGLAEGPTALVEAPGNVAHARAKERHAVETIKGVAENLAFDQVSNEQLKALIAGGESLLAGNNDQELASSVEALKAERDLRHEEVGSGMDPVPAESVIGAEPSMDAADPVNIDDPFADLVPEEQTQEADAGTTPDVEPPVAEGDSPLFTFKEDDIDLSLLEEREADIKDRYAEMSPEEQTRADGLLSSIADIRDRTNALKTAGAVQEEVAPAAAPKPTKSQIAKQSHAKARKVDPKADRLTVAIAKMGGLSKAEAEASGIDPADMGRHGWRIMRTFNNGQNADTLDGMRERLNGEGFNFETLNDLLNALHDDVGGKPVMTAAGLEGDMEAKYQDRQAQMEDANEDLPPTDEFTGNMYMEPVDESEPTVYEPSWGEEARTLHELYNEADQLDSAAAEAIFESGQDDTSVALQLYDLIRDKRNATNNRTGTPADQGEGQEKPGDGQVSTKAIAAGEASEPAKGITKPPGEIAPNSEPDKTPPSSGVFSGQEKTVDLLGDDTSTAQNTADLSREKDQKRSPAGDRPAEAQSGNDLFANGGQLEPDLFADNSDESVSNEYLDKAHRALQDGKELSAKLQTITGFLEDWTDVMNGSAPPGEIADSVVDTLDELRKVADQGNPTQQETADALAMVGEQIRDWAKSANQSEGAEALFKLTPVYEAFAQIKRDPKGQSKLSGTIDSKANEAATSPANNKPEPTQAQKEAGNYEVGKVRLHGMDISIENPKGSTRSGTDSGGKEWSQEMKHHYGYIKGSVGRDKDHVDVFLTDNAENAGTVFVVDQVDPSTRKFDEHKVVIGPFTQEEAHAAYQANYEKGWNGADAITEMDVDEFKTWVKDPSKTSKRADGKPINPQKTSVDSKEGTYDLGGRRYKTKVFKTDDAANAFLEQNKGWGVIGTIDSDVHVARNEDKGVSLDVDEIKPKTSSNKVFTEDAAEKARALLKSKLGQVNTGLDPETVQAGITLAGFHIEKGARTFAAYSKAMVDDLGESVRPYLRAWYESIRYYPGMEKMAKEMTDPGDMNVWADQGSAFIPTHELSNGTQVIASDDEPGIWVDKNGDEIEDNSATPIHTKEKPAKLNVTDNKVDDANEPKQLDIPSEETLERVSASQVSGVKEGRDTGSGTRGGGQADLFGDKPVGESGDAISRSVGDDSGEVPVSTEKDGGGREHGQSRSKTVSRSDSGAKSADTGRSRAVTPAKDRATDFKISPEIQIGAGGAKTKFKGNVAAIKLLRQLQQETRQATREEQAVLAKYVGWGGIPQAFYKDGEATTKGWDGEAAELKDLLTSEEYEAARRSTQDAHYTSTEIVSSIWDAVRRFGFQGGKVLEPSVGVGNFFGLMPGEFRAKSGLTGVELDHITGGIAKHLYPGAHILDSTGFQDFTAADNTYDLVVGNPPFGSQKLYDGKRKNLSKFSIHNYFFAKSVDLLKPNGVLAMVVSSSMLDSYGDRARQHISDRTELLGAIRLPNNAFLKNAGTEVTTDIVFLRKLKEGEQSTGESWMDVQEVSDPAGKDDIPLNEYFVRHPENLLGRMERSGSMYRGDAPALVAEEGQDTSRLLADAVTRLDSNFMDAPGRTPVEEKPEVQHDVKDVRVGSMFTKDGEIYIRTEDVENAPQAEKVEFTRKYKGDMIPDKKAEERVKGMLKVRDALARLRGSQLSESVGNGELKIYRAALNKAYDSFVNKHGPINQDTNKRVFRDDPTWPQIAALEENFDKGVSLTVARRTGETLRKPSAKKAAIFTKRTQSPYKPVTSANSSKDALVASLSEKGRIDEDYMARIYDKPFSQIREELRGLILNNPTGSWETREQYLSGNVRTKLSVAEEAAKSNPEYQENVDALMSVQPADIEAVDIDVKVGAHWLPPKVMSDFVDHITGGSGGAAAYSSFNAKWSFSSRKSNADKATQWGTERRSPIDLLTDVANQKATIVRDKVDKNKTVINEEATNAAQEKAGQIRDEWRNWIWQDETRRSELARLYNDSFNTDVPREYDGSHLTFPGQVSDDIVKLRPHQANASWRIVQSDTTLLDHVVGAGKTYTVIAAAMEMRRLGLSKKPVIVVPNHLVGQWAEDFIKLYPGANVLAATKKDFEKSNRKKLFARISTGDWDSVIVAHSSFGKLEVDPEFQDKFIKEQIKDLDQAIAAIKEAETGKTRSVKDAEKQKERLKEKLKKLFDAENKDDSLYFGELGIDALFLDEAHEFKNLAFATSMTRVAGLGNPQGSQKAADMFMKIQYTLEKTGGRNVVFATGTPISNTMAEMFTMQRYLSYPTLKAKGLAHFDAWAKQYGEVVTDWELSPSGTYKLNSRFAKFVNMPELMQDYLSVADVINRDDINEMLAKQGKKLPVPKIKHSKPQNIVVERSSGQASYIGESFINEHGKEEYPEGTLVWRAENLPKGPPKKGDDNMLKIMSDARKAALDMRMIYPGHSDNEQSKINYAAGEILRMYKIWEKDKGAQLVFIDLSTPKSSRAKEAAEIRSLIEKAEAGDEAAEAKLDKLSPDQLAALEGGDFSVYDDLRQKLINLGIPDNEIAYIHQANTELQKEELFGKVRSGRIRVLLGSTAKMGAGMNVQERLVGLHHMDAPWRPSDLEQREGRIIRQGNALYDKDPDGFEIEILRYATKQTLDSRMWQTIEGKARFIEQVRKGNLIAREVEDVAGEAANAAEMKAASSGNPLILEEMEVRTGIRKLEGMKYTHDKQQFRIRDSIKHSRNVIALQTTTLENLEKDIQTRNRNGSKKFSIKIEGKTYTKRKEAGARLLLSAAELDKSGKSFKKAGKYAGFSLTIDNLGKRGFIIGLQGAGEYQIELNDLSEADPTGLATRVGNITKGFDKLVEQSTAWKNEAESAIPGLESQLGNWEKSQDLADLKKHHAEIISELRPKNEITESESTEIAETEQDEPKLSRAKDKANPALYPIYGMPREEIESLVMPIVKAWKNSPELIVAGSMSDPRIPAALRIENERQLSQGASGDVEGFFYKGTVYLISDNLRSPERAAQVLMHESLGHAGMRGVFGKDMVNIMKQIANVRRKEVAAKAEQYGFDMEVESDRLDAAEEYLAELAETKPHIGYVRRAIAAIRKWLRKHVPYFRKMKLTDDEIIQQFIVPARRHVEQGEGKSQGKSTGEPKFSRTNSNNSNSQEVNNLLIDAIKKGQPIDQIFQIPFNVIGSVDKRGNWHPPESVSNFAEMATARLNAAATSVGEKLPWAAHLVNEAKAGLIDRYGLTDEYKARDNMRESDERTLAMQGVEIIQDLEKRGVDAAEAKVLQSILNDETIPTEEWSEISEPVRKAIDEMGQEAVLLGLISNESYERNKGSYLHRVYMKHEDTTSLGGWASKVIATRRKKIVGNTLKGRGMDLKVTTERVLRDVPEAWFGRKLKKGAADKQLKDHSFIVFDRMSHTGEGTKTAPGIEDGGRKPRLLERAFWPADKPVPAKFGSWNNKGTWEVRSTQGNKVVLWRDFTKEERLNMGEILDARYTIAKTFQQMSHDLATGRFLKDIAANDAWAWVGEGEPENATTAKEGTYRAYGNHEWVLVPNTAIPGTGGKKRWGDLSGRYVRAEIWRDLNELDRMNTSGTWRKILTQWKLNKTARNPVVHMNNVMSNMLFMDMAGVRMSDLLLAVDSMRNNDQEYQEAMNNGAFGGSFVNQEIKRNILDPIMDELKKQNMSDQGEIEQRIGRMGRFMDTIWKYGKNADKWMIEKYQLEDEIFRMATYHRRRALGETPAEAALVAKEQFLNYDIRAPWVNAARNTFLPFISYTYRAVPVIAESIAKRPWKLAKYAAIAYGLNALAYAMSDGDEDKERRSLRDQEQGDTWLPGVPRMLRMPWRDGNDNPVFLDIRRWIPAGDIFDTNQGQGTGIPAPLQLGGPLMLAGEFMLNKTAFTGREIWNNKTDHGSRKVAKIADWAWKSWMPSAPWIYNSWYWDKISRSVTGGRDYAGRNYDTAGAVVSSMGIKLKPQDVEMGFAWKERDFNAIERALKYELKSLQRDRDRNLISKEAYKEEANEIMDQMRKMRQKAKETFSSK